MELRIYTKSRDGIVFAEAIYTLDKTIVLPGSRIKNSISKSVRGYVFAKQLLNDRSCVSQDGKVLKECIFNSPSMAATFVTGNASNGYRVWKTKEGITLGNFLKENNLR